MTTAEPDKPDSARTCSECGCGQNTDQSTIGRFLKNGEVVDAHLSCADKSKLDAVDAWAESGE